METRFMKKMVWLLGMTLCLPVVSSCSSDDDDNGGDDGFNAEGTEISIPASVVDGVRVQEVTADDEDAAIKVTYNEDGTVKSATTAGQEFLFEYKDDTRSATPTGRKLVKIYSSVAEIGGDERAEFTATNFTFNTDGYVVKYKEDIKSSAIGERDHTVLTSTLSYNSHGRISRISLAGKSSGWDEYDGNYSYSGSSVINYEYNGGALTKSELTDDEGETYTISYGYATNAHTNTYNVMTPQLAIGVAMYSPILYILAITGYLGNASASLPTQYTILEDEYVQTFDVNYAFWDNNKIRSVTTTCNGYSVTFGYRFTESVTTK